MKTVAKLGLALGVFATMGFAENLTGKLIDAACHDKSQQNPADSKQKADISVLCGDRVDYLVRHRDVGWKGLQAGCRR